jgi:hypothetical protein
MLTSPLTAHWMRVMAGNAPPAPPPPDHGPVDAAIRLAAGRAPAPSTGPPPSPAPAVPADGGAREFSAPRQPANPNETINAAIRSAGGRG